MYHAVLVNLCLTEITHYRVISALQYGPSSLVAQATTFAFTQMCLQRSHQGVAVHHLHPAHSSRDTIRCELRLVVFWEYSKGEVNRRLKSDISSRHKTTFLKCFLK
jgi:hypothetical protein